jgi:hypothetical protein
MIKRRGERKGKKDKMKQISYRALQQQQQVNNNRAG